MNNFSTVVYNLRNSEPNDYTWTSSYQGLERLAYQGELHPVEILMHNGDRASVLSWVALAGAPRKPQALLKM